MNAELEISAAPQTAVPWIAVREFCAFVAKSGDLDLRFTPAPTAEQGMAGHQTVTMRRGAGYRREVTAGGIVAGLGLRGRVDGLFEQSGAIEEIKTFRGDLAAVPDNHRALHWAQLKTYGALYCQTQGRAEIELRLVYFDIDNQTEHIESARFRTQELSAFLHEHALRYQAWAAAQQAHKQARDRALAAAAFPHARIAPGQRTLMTAATQSIADGQPLLAQAPTGVGKTIATLFPALKAVAAGTLDKLFYLTAKTSGRRAAVDALRSLGGGGPTLRVLELTARSKACEHPDKACHGQSCPLAKGFYDRLPAARDAAQRVSGPRELRAVALEHRVCPYYLSQEMVRWSDVVVADVNYYFDQSALLYALTRRNGWRVAVLADEAHNLIERGRAMYSASISQASSRGLGARVPGEIAAELAELERAWTKLVAAAPADEVALAAPPAEFCEALARVAARLSAHFAQDPTRRDADVLAFYFEALGFLRLADSFGAHSFCDLEIQNTLGGLFGEPAATLAIRNVVPAPHLAPRIRAARTVIAFSATLTPADFYGQMLGFPDDSGWCDAPTQFGSDQLEVQRITHIPTGFRQRRASAMPIAAAIAAQYRRRPGNYFAFFSSFAYLELVADAFAGQHPEIPTLRQRTGDSEGERAQLLNRFTIERGVVGFAVLGGVFAESIDLHGERLIGVFITTLGLAVYNAHNQRMAARIDELFGPGTGDAYTYLYPGLRRVTQAAGRVIRSTSDTGTVFLIDPRYRNRQTRALLPAWWQMRG